LLRLLITRAPSKPTPPPPPSNPYFQQNNEYVFSMLVWHEKLLYDEETWNSASKLAQKFTSMGAGLRSFLGR